MATSGGESLKPFNILLKEELADLEIISTLWNIHLSLEPFVSFVTKNA